MTEDHTPGADDDVDVGTPVVELRELLVMPPTALLTKVRGSIHRRLFTADSVDFGLRGFFEVFMAYLDVLFGACRGKSAPKEGR